MSNLPRLPGYVRIGPPFRIVGCLPDFLAEGRSSMRPCVQSVNAVVRAAALARIALREIGATHRYAAARFIAGLAAAQILKRKLTCGLPLPPAKSAGLQRLGRVYLQLILSIADEASNEMVNALLHQGSPAEVAVEARRRIDRSVWDYLENVRAILSSKETTL